MGYGPLHSVLKVRSQPVAVMTVVNLWDVRTVSAASRWDITQLGYSCFQSRWSNPGCASKDKTVKLWDVSTRQMSQNLPGTYYRWVTSVAFSPDG